MLTSRFKPTLRHVFRISYGMSKRVNKLIAVASQNTHSEAWYQQLEDKV